jgi:hypothetical protein
LNDLPLGFGDDRFDPFIPDHSPIGSLTDGFEVFSAVHRTALGTPSSRRRQKAMIGAQRCKEQALKMMKSGRFARFELLNCGSRADGLRKGD